jgi:hypothetical protein
MNHRYTCDKCGNSTTGLRRLKYIQELGTSNEHCFRAGLCAKCISTLRCNKPHCNKPCAYVRESTCEGRRRRIIDEGFVDYCQRHYQHSSYNAAFEYDLCSNADGYEQDAQAEYDISSGAHLYISELCKYDYDLYVPMIRLENLNKQNYILRLLLYLFPKYKRVCTSALLYDIDCYNRKLAVERPVLRHVDYEFIYALYYNSTNLYAEACGYEFY